MLKKCISLITLAAFIVFSMSCAPAFLSLSRGTMKYVGEDKVAAWEGKKVKILSVTKNSGEFIEFSKESPVGIRDNAIIGRVKVKREKKLIEIDSSDVKTKDPMNRIGTEIVTKDGKKYSLIAHRPDGSKYTVRELEYKSISIPLSEVREIAIVNRGKGALRGLGIGILIGGGTTLLVSYLVGSQSEREDPNPLLVYAILLGPPVAFGLIGLLTGLNSGVTDHYIITAATDSTSAIEE